MKKPPQGGNGGSLGVGRMMASLRILEKPTAPIVQNIESKGKSLLTINSLATDNKNTILRSPMVDSNSSDFKHLSNIHSINMPILANNSQQSSTQPSSNSNVNDAKPPQEEVKSKPATAKPAFSNALGFFKAQKNEEKKLLGVDEGKPNFVETS